MTSSLKLDYSEAVEFVVEAIDPIVKSMYSKFREFLGWELGDFRQEAYVKVLSSDACPDETGDVVAYFTKIYKNHVLDCVRKKRSQSRTADKASESGVFNSVSYNDERLMDLAFMIENQLGSNSKAIVVGLLNGKKVREIIDGDEDLTMRSYYKALDQIKVEVQKYVVG